MTYNKDIPQSTDIQSASQGQLLINFQQLQSIFDANHYTWDFATVATRGMHRFATFESQATAPASTATQNALYSKTVSAAPQLFFRRASSGTEVQMTATADPVIATTGQSFLPGGVIVKWGQVTATSSPYTITFSTAFPTTCLFGMVCPFSSSAAAVLPYVSTWGASSITVARGTGTGNYAVTWIAIGS
jgi:hypothetical protein